MALVERVLGLVALSVLLAGCGAEPPTETDNSSLEGDEQFVRLQNDLGEEGVYELLTSADREEISGLLAYYGMRFDVVVKDLNSCPHYYPAAERSFWQAFDGEFYYIDSSGRPKQAYKDLPPIVAGVRNDSCQLNVGQWGDAENPSNDYDGGHMIGSQLGGFGKRANLVPQDANFNRGNWAVLENKMATCGSLPANRLRYSITVGYPNSTALIPSSFNMKITNQSTGSNVSLSFSNTDGGGANGPSEKNRGVSFLTSQGCN